MKCPICTTTLRELTTIPATIDICPDCKGIWFDEGELLVFVRALSASNKIKPRKIKLYQRKEVKNLYTTEEKTRLCPKCEKELTKFNYAGDSNVFLDKCPDCGGIWADAGEAKAIAEYIKEDPTLTALGSVLAKSISSPEPVGLKQGIGYTMFFPRIIVPLGDNLEREKFPIVTLSIIILTILFSLIRLYLDHTYLSEIFNFINEDFVVTDVIGSMVLSTGIVSLIWNMFFLWLFGDNVEDRFSKLGYLTFYFSCGIFATILYALLGSNLPLSAAGISGAVSGILGAYFVFYPTANIKLFVIFKTMDIPSVVCLGVWFLFQFIYPFLFEVKAVTSTTCIATISGFLLGAIIAAIKKSSTNA